MIGTGAAALSLNDSWTTSGDIASRGRGESVSNATDLLLLFLIAEAITTLVLVFRTDFSQSRRRQREANTETSDEP